MRDPERQQPDAPRAVFRPRALQSAPAEVWEADNAASVSLWDRPPDPGAPPLDDASDEGTSALRDAISDMRINAHLHAQAPSVTPGGKRRSGASQLASVQSAPVARMPAWQSPEHSAALNLGQARVHSPSGDEQAADTHGRARMTDGASKGRDLQVESPLSAPAARQSVQVTHSAKVTVAAAAPDAPLATQVDAHSCSEQHPATRTDAAAPERATSAKPDSRAHKQALASPHAGTPDRRDQPQRARRASSRSTRVTASPGKQRDMSGTVKQQPRRLSVRAAASGANAEPAALPKRGSSVPLSTLAERASSATGRSHAGHKSLGLSADTSSSITQRRQRTPDAAATQPSPAQPGDAQAAHEGCLEAEMQVQRQLAHAQRAAGSRGASPTRAKQRLSSKALNGSAGSTPLQRVEEEDSAMTNLTTANGSESAGTAKYASCSVSSLRCIAMLSQQALLRNRNSCSRQSAPPRVYHDTIRDGCELCHQQHE